MKRTYKKRKHIKPPTRYNKKFIKAVEKYLDEKEKNNAKYKENKIKKVELPGIEDFALYIGASKRAVYDWEKSKPKFAKALDKIRLVAKTMLINNGLAGTYSPVIAKLILSHNYGMSDVSSVKIDGKIENTFSDETANRIADRIANRKREDDSPSGSG